MATVAFSALPPEIYVIIAEHCDSKDLNNLCLTSKLMNQCFVRALYRHVDLQTLQFRCFHNTIFHSKRQQQFFHTLLSHPEHGKHVRSLKTNTCLGGHYKTMISQKELWRAMQSLTHVQSVDLQGCFIRSIRLETKDLPNNLFPSATSVRFAGHCQYGIVKSIINAVNPATLKHLCLDLVKEYVTEQLGAERIKRLTTTSGLLMTLTGRCTALRTLRLQRIGYVTDFGRDQSYNRQYGAEEEASYIELASFIRSVQGTVEEFTFEQVGRYPVDMSTVEELEFRIMDERFLRLLLPTIVSGNWACLTMMELRGVRALNDRDGKAALMRQLRAVLGGDTKIVVKESTRGL